jgi:hypothetical protein
MFQNISTLEVVELSLPIPLSDVRYMFARCPKLKSVFGALDLSLCTQTAYFTWNSPLLEDIEFVPNTIITSIAFDLNSGTKFTKKSLTSIINGLSPEKSELTVTLKKTAVDNTFETAAGLADGSTSAEWATLIATKPNWTISLA